MEKPSSSDPNFKAFLDKLKEQSGGGILAQKETTKGIDKTNESLRDLKDKTSSVRDSIKEGLYNLSDDIIELQDQLDTANDSLSEIATAVTGSKDSLDQAVHSLSNIKEALTGLKAAVENVGYDVGKDIDSGHLVATMGAIGANTTKLLDEMVKELSLVRKLTEGSVEYDKEAAQYRNTSGRDVESKVSGKTSKDGGFIDFETARDTLSGQGERARKENKVFLATGVTSTRSGVKPGDATASSLGANLGSSGRPEDEASEVAPSRNTSIKRARRERGSAEAEVGAKNKKEEVDNFDPSILGRLKSFMTDGESDKADTAKEDLELSKEMLDTTKEELTLLKQIKDALAPKTPAELGDNKVQGLGAAGAAQAPEASSSSGVNIDLPGLPDKKDGKPGKETGKAGKAAAKGIGKSLLKKIPVIGAVAGLAYGASRAMSGDFAGAGMEVASGLAGTIPGVGTAASVGIDAALAAKDAGVFDKEQAPATAPAPAPAAAPKPAPVQATAPVATASASLGGAIAATAAPAATKPSKGTSSFKGSENLEKLQIAEGELQGLYSDLRDEKGKLLEKFVNDRKRFPDGVPSDPSDPDYPKELKAIDDKYQKQIDAKKKEVSELGKAPGISEAKKAEKDFDDDLDKGFSDEAPAKSVSKVTGGNVKSSEFAITSTQSVETVTGGETTTKRVLTDDAKKAEAELTGMSGKHTAERKQAVDKLKSEGKITGRFATDEDYQKIPELKDLKAKQDAERSVIAKRVDKGTSTDVSKVSIDNATMRDEISASRSDSSTVVSNNVSSNNTTKFVPMKSSPRAENTGSALDRYTSRITTY